MERFLGALQLFKIFGIPFSEEICLLSEFPADDSEGYFFIVSPVFGSKILLGIKSYLLNDAVNFLVIEVTFGFQHLCLARVLLSLR